MNVHYAEINNFLTENAKMLKHENHTSKCTIESLVNENEKLKNQLQEIDKKQGCDLFDPANQEDTIQKLNEENEKLSNLKFLYKIYLY